MRGWRSCPVSGTRAESDFAYRSEVKEPKINGSINGHANGEKVGSEEADHDDSDDDDEEEGAAVAADGEGGKMVTGKAFLVHC